MDWLWFLGFVAAVAWIVAIVASSQPSIPRS